MSRKGTGVGGGGLKYGTDGGRGLVVGMGGLGAGGEGGGRGMGMVRGIGPVVLSESGLSVTHWEEDLLWIIAEVVERNRIRVQEGEERPSTKERNGWNGIGVFVGVGSVRQRKGLGLDFI